jgi:coproporphyrinogen III oxidase
MSKDKVVSYRRPFSEYVYELQDRICEALEGLEEGSARFREDNWDRPGGGGGRTRVIEDGTTWEKGGVNVSEVHGELPKAVRKQLDVKQGWFYATGVSLVIHPQNPMVPTVHANYRYFELYEDENGPLKDAWFGGGADLTPYYLFEEDARHFHQELKQAADTIDPALYPAHKKACDEYFTIVHRDEMRGIGGVFYDYLRPNKHFSQDDWYRYQRRMGDAFLPAFIPIAERRMHLEYQEHHRLWQEVRRGRYAEFNLVYDRGTLFGLRTQGRIESILMSLPPRARWRYDYRPEEGSWEAATQAALHPRDWAMEEPTES